MEKGRQPCLAQLWAHRDLSVPVSSLRGRGQECVFSSGPGFTGRDGCGHPATQAACDFLSPPWDSLCVSHGGCTRQFNAEQLPGPTRESPARAEAWRAAPRCRPESRGGVSSHVGARRDWIGHPAALPFWSLMKRRVCLSPVAHQTIPELRDRGCCGHGWCSVPFPAVGALTGPGCPGTAVGRSFSVCFSGSPVTAVLEGQVLGARVLRAGAAVHAEEQSGRASPSVNGGCCCSFCLAGSSCGHSPSVRSELEALAPRLVGPARHCGSRQDRECVFHRRWGLEGPRGSPLPSPVPLCHQLNSDCPLRVP